MTTLAIPGSPNISRQAGIAAVVLVVGWMICAADPAARAQTTATDVSEMDMEHLLDIQVTSAAKRQEPLFHTASAIHVITQADIQRSGATSIPDVLRMVPGLQVAQMDSRGWAISARGFGERYANKLLVLVDGRSVYDPLFSGVYWDALNLMLADIDRIEVIRGPGATLWGANAVNGVINIITRSSADTQGGLISVSTGSNEPVNTSLRYGGKLGSKATYRLYGNYFRRDTSVDATGNSNHDDWQAGVGGFRADWKPSAANSYLFESEMTGRGGGESLVLPLLTPPFQEISTAREDHRGGHVLGSWDHLLPRGGDWHLQAYYDGVFRNTQALNERLNTIDFDFRHHIRIGRRHDLIWGLGYRAVLEDFTGSFVLTVPSETEHRFSTLVQDEITLVPYRLELIPGSKFEREPHGGWNTQPSVRLLWTPAIRYSLWAAVSRAVRTPADFEINSRINSQVIPSPPGPPNLVSVFGDEDFLSEKLVAYEAGYRASPSKRVSLDFTSFYNVYHDLETTESSAPFLEINPEPPHVVIPQRFGNGMRGETYGAEMEATWTPLNRWSFSAAYSRLEIQLHLDPSSNGRNGETAEHNSPNHQIQLGSHLSLPRNLIFDTTLEYVGALSSLAVPAYTRLDGQWSWQPSESATISIGGQNLLEPRHLEFGNFRQVGLIGQAERNIYIRLTCRF